jgi:hypothetical protein
MKRTTIVAAGALATAALTGLLAGSASAQMGGTNGISKAATAAVQFANAGSYAGTIFDDAGKHDCKGKNACKGHGGCKSGDAGCKGKNSCKGKGGCNTNK